MHGDRTRPWSVAELQEFLRVEREKFLAGPPRPAGDLILVCHETLMRALARPEQVDLPTLFTDRRESCENEAGDYILALKEGAIAEGHIRAELGEVLAGDVAGRTSEEEITIFESLGSMMV